MPEEFTMPKLGLTMTEGTIREWLVADGATVQAGEPVLLIETDKVETEVEVRSDGVLRVTGEPGLAYACGDVIGYLFDEADQSGTDSDEPDASITPKLWSVPAAPDTEPEPEPSLFVVGAQEATEDPMVVPPEVADEIAAMEVVLAAVPAADTSPVVEATVAEHVSPEPVDAVVSAIVPATAPISSPIRSESQRIAASPRARAAARELDLDLALIRGSGPAGRIVHDDVSAAHEELVAAQRRAAQEQAEAERRQAERLAQEQAEAERRHAERLEQERVQAEQTERELLEAERLEREHLDAERIERERLEAERLEQERIETERREAAQNEADRLAAERAQAERDEAERIAALPPPPLPERPLPAAAVIAEPIQAASAMPAVAAPVAVEAAGPAATSGARMLADFLGVDLRRIPSESGTRLTREDVGAWVRAELAPDSASSASSPEDPMVEMAPLLQEPSQVIPFRGMRGVIAERMHSSLSEMAQLTLSVDVDVTGINIERARRKSLGETVPGYTAWVVAAASQALGEHPYVNSQITADGVALLPDVHVGVAVALDEGLIVPVVEHANLRSVEETHSVVADLAGRARNRKLAFEDLEGATFSVTALGMYGVDVFTPVINPPNTAILGVGRLRSETAWIQGQPRERTAMTLSLTWDHRAFDGAPAAEFAQTIVRLLESPAELV